MNLRLVISFLVFETILVATPVSAADRYASPTGTPDGDGTRDQPWDLTTALNAHDKIGPGDTLWLLAGTYRHPDRSNGSQGYAFSLAGAPDKPVTIRPEAGQRVTLDGGLHTAADPEPKHVEIHGLEILASENLIDGERRSDIAGSHPDRGVPWGGVTLKNGHDLKLINCVIHASSNGVGFWRTVGGESEIYGNIIFDNGWVGPDRSHGHGLYTQNTGESYKHVRDNLIIDNYARCVQAYGSSRTEVKQYRFEGNYFGDRRKVSNVLFGGTSPDCGNRDAHFVSNLHYQATLRVGYNCGAHDVLLKNSTFIRGGWQAHPDSTGVRTEQLTLWRTEHPNHPAPEDITFLRPNLHDPGRANLVIIQPGRSERMFDADLSGFLRKGDSFRIQNARDFFGEAVVKATYQGGTIAIPMRGFEEAAFVILVEENH